MENKPAEPKGAAGLLFGGYALRGDAYAMRAIDCNRDALRDVGVQAQDVRV